MKVTWALLTLILAPCMVSAEAPRSTVILGADLEAGEPANSDPLQTPFGIDFDAAGNMLIVELEGGRVHNLDRAGRLTTIAGNGSKSYTGDGGIAKAATFNGMHNVAVTPAGDVFIADSWNHCIRKITAKTGVISTIAGTGEAGFSGDGGKAIEATFDFIMCVSLNSANNKLYVADLRNRRIRVVDIESGIVSTVAGNGEKGIPADGQLATQSPLVDPRAVAVDSQDNVYILERSGHALRVVTKSGRIYTVAGTGEKGAADGPALQAQLNSPKHIAIDLQDRVLIADDANARIRRFDPSRKTVTTILGDGSAKPARILSHPHGVYVHPDGSVYVVDTMHHRILRLQF